MFFFWLKLMIIALHQSSISIPVTLMLTLLPAGHDLWPRSLICSWYVFWSLLLTLLMLTEQSPALMFPASAVRSLKSGWTPSLRSELNTGLRSIMKNGVEDLTSWSSIVWAAGAGLKEQGMTRHEPSRASTRPGTDTETAALVPNTLAEHTKHQTATFT